MASSSLGAGGIAPPAAYSSPSKLNVGGDVEAFKKHLVPVPMNECVKIDQIDVCKFLAANALTGERKVLAPGAWGIEHDDEGKAVLFRVPSEDSEEVVLLDLDEVFGKRVSRHDGNGELFVLQQGVDKLQSLDAIRTKYSTADITVKSGVSSATFVMRVFIFHFARPGNQVMFWDMPQLYGFLSMKSYAGQRSTWVAKTKGRWLAAMQQAFDIECRVDSSHGNSKTCSRDAVPAHSCLPVFSVNTVGFMLLLTRWAFASRERGGLQDDRPRAAATELFHAMFHAWSAEACAPLDIQIHFVKRFEPMWPRPQPFGAEGCAIQVDAEGHLVWSSLQAAATGKKRNQVACAWWKQIKQSLCERSPIKLPLLRVLQFCVEEVKLRACLSAALVASLHLC